MAGLTFKDKNGEWVTYPNPQEQIEWLESEVKRLESKSQESDSLPCVRLSLPSQNEIDEQIDGYAFRVPYDGSNNFYDEVALKHYKAGIEWLLKKIKSNEA